MDMLSQHVCLQHLHFKAEFPHYMLVSSWSVVLSLSAIGFRNFIIPSSSFLFSLSSSFLSLLFLFFFSSPPHPPLLHLHPLLKSHMPANISCCITSTWLTALAHKHEYEVITIQTAAQPSLHTIPLLWSTFTPYTLSTHYQVCSYVSL